MEKPRHIAALAIFLLFTSGLQANARGVPNSFADLAARLLPTAVKISATQTLSADDSGSMKSQGGSALDRIFGSFARRDTAPPRRVASLGSGFVIDTSGLIVTNNHVIEGADEIRVTLNDGTILPATLVGRDNESDLALIRVAPPAPLPAAHFGDSDHARVGDWVMAIGNPYGLGNSVTAGIVSARDRDLAEGSRGDFIQTDAPINRGNSGGPLFDMDGDVVGVASALYSPSGGSVGIGFAIPSKLAQIVVRELRAYGRVRHGWIGVRTESPSSEIAASSGAIVSEAIPGSPAADAGVRSGDIITAVDGTRVANSRALPRLIAELVAGNTVKLEIVRNGQQQVLPITVKELKEQVSENKLIDSGFSSDSKSIGSAAGDVD